MEFVALIACKSVLTIDSSSFCFATCVYLFACDSGRLVEPLLRNVCLSVCLRLGSTRQALASQRVSVCLRLESVCLSVCLSACDSSSFCFATCVCLSACDTALVARPAHTPLRDLADTVVAYALAQLAANATDRLGESKIHPWRHENPPSGVQNRAKIAPEATRSAQERPRAPQERPKSAPRAPQERPRAPREPPRAPQERPKSDPRAPKSAQERPRAPQERPNASQERPKASQERLSITVCSATRSRNAFATIFDRFSRRARKRGHTRNVYFPEVFLQFFHVFR